MTSEAARRGSLIVFEGPEGAGKTTQAARLAEHMRARQLPVVSVREPGATPLGERIREVLLGSADVVEARAEVLLFLAARAQLVPVLEQHLAAGRTVIADRFMLSTYAYQVAGRGLPEDLVRAANHLAVGGLVPSLTLVLLHPPEAGLARKRQAGGAGDRIERAGVDFHRRVAEAFTTSTSEGWQRVHVEFGPIVGIDASGSEADVAERVRHAVTAACPHVMSS
jgi:dTMP kinase